MSIWKSNITLEQLNGGMNINMVKHIGIEFTEIGKDYLKGTMPVDERTTQPYGVLHGGASAVLAETLGSVGAAMCTDMKIQQCYGMEINANHIRSAKKGFVEGIAKPIHIGGRSQVWEIRIMDEAQQLVCISRLTLAVTNKRT